MEGSITSGDQTITPPPQAQFLETNHHPHNQAFTQKLCTEHHV